ncbi:MAG: MFS transporter [Spirochaetaceae bacterium]|jgi:MFS family permease|nr:MFS transporter [Spirochaetaceae bacterium]
MAKRGFGAYMGVTFLIGFGFFTMGLMDPLYDTYVPLFLRRYVASNALVGGIMTLDNVLQLLLIPIIAVWSDRTRTRIGRRMPFIVVMLPLSALLFHFIPVTAALSLGALVALLFVFNIFKTSVRGPVVALMPDTVPGEFRSEANGVINTMGGLGLIVGTLGLTRLMDRSEGLPFTVASLFILLAVAVLLLFVRERSAGENAAEERIPVLKSVRLAFSAGNGAPQILISLFLWFTAYEGVKPFLGLYLVEVLGVAESNAALAQGVAGISSVLAAIPAGYLAHRLGRRRYIRLCLCFLAAILILIPLSGALALAAGVSGTGRFVLFLALMFCYGAFWMGVVVNSFPMLWQMARFGNVGVYTGLYYTFSQGAAILAPPLTGALIDLSGYPGIFILGGACMLAAFLVMGSVRSGEAGSAPLGESPGGAS